jgi:type 1 fimbria pilin
MTVQAKAGVMSVVAMILSVSGPVSAQQTGDQLSVAFSGVLKKRPCHIDNDRRIEVAFGNVGVLKVDGERYRQTVSYHIICDAPEPGGRLMLSVKGVAAGFDDGVLATNAAGLGILIRQNGQRLPLNTPLLISLDHPPALEAVPVKASSASLAGGRFQATATLLAEYE